MANKPVLFYGIEAIANAGIRDIGIVVGETQARKSERLSATDRNGAFVSSASNRTRRAASPMPSRSASRSSERIRS